MLFCFVFLKYKMNIDQLQELKKNGDL